MAVGRYHRSCQVPSREDRESGTLAQHRQVIRRLAEASETHRRRLLLALAVIWVATVALRILAHWSGMRPLAAWQTGVDIAAPTVVLSVAALVIVRAHRVRAQYLRALEFSLDQIQHSQRRFADAQGSEAELATALYNAVSALGVLRDRIRLHAVDIDRACELLREGLEQGLEVLRRMRNRSGCEERLMGDTERLVQVLGGVNRGLQPVGGGPAAESESHFGSVLLVGDQVLDLSACEMLLTPLFRRTVVAQTVSEALLRVGRTRFDLVVLDLASPEQSNALIRVARVRSPKPAIIVLVGHSDDREFLRTAFAGADSVVAKPLTAADLEEVVWELSASGVLAVPANSNVGEHRYA